MQQYYVGIDNGLNGGITVLDNNGNILLCTTMPTLGKGKKDYDIVTINNLLQPYKTGSLTYLEKAQAHFRDGKKQSFKTGYGYGIMLALLCANQMSHQIVAPKVWQRKVFAGLNSTDTKLASAQFCQRKWPAQSWHATARCTTVHDGMTDSACIAHYGYSEDAQ